VSLVVGDQLTLGAFTSIGPESDKWLKDRYPLQLGGTSTAVTVVRTQTPLIVEDTETDSRLAEVARRRGFRSLLMVPMMCQGRAIGTINVTRPNPGPFSYEERELLKTFADQSGHRH
jgi:two-component system, NtrC family, sensor kinase